MNNKKKRKPREPKLIPTHDLPAGYPNVTPEKKRLFKASMEIGEIIMELEEEYPNRGIGLEALSSSLVSAISMMEDSKVLFEEIVELMREELSVVDEFHGWSDYRTSELKN